MISSSLSLLTERATSSGMQGRIKIPTDRKNMQHWRVRMIEMKLLCETWKARHDTHTETRASRFGEKAFASNCFIGPLCVCVSCLCHRALISAIDWKALSSLCFYDALSTVETCRNVCEWVCAQISNSADDVNRQSDEGRNYMPIPVRSRNVSYHCFLLFSFHSWRDLSG